MEIRPRIKIQYPIKNRSKGATFFLNAVTLYGYKIIL